MQQLPKETLIELWLERSQKALKAAENNVTSNDLEASLNRVYYAIFYAVRALAEKENFTTSKHASLMGWFNKKFVYEDKVFAPELFEVYRKSFEYREKSDYNVIYKPDLKTIQKLLADAKVFVEEVRKVT